MELTEANHRFIENVRFAFSSINGMKALFALVTETLKRGVPGDFVECGVASGGQAAIIGKALVEQQSLKTLHLFDSFQGLPFAGPLDDCQPGIGAKQHDDSLPLRERLTSCGMNICDEPGVRANFAASGLANVPLKFYPGWFQDTLPVLPPQAIPEICFLHLDADLYESTLICLEHLYPRVVSGGVVAIDDYALSGCALAVQHYFKELPCLTVFGDYGAVYLVKP